MVVKNEKGISFHAVFDWTERGVIIPANPKIINKLKLLLPKIFANTISWCFCAEAKTFTINSGADVPKATMVSPIANWEMLNLLAMADALSTNKSAPFKTRIKPRMISITIYITIY